MRYCYYIASIFLNVLCLGMLISCGGDDNTKATDGSVVISADSITLSKLTNPMLTHFGFVGVDCRFDDPSDNLSIDNYINEIASFSNIAHMCVFGPDESIAIRIDNFQSHQIKSLLHIESIFFSSKKSEHTGSGFRLTLYEDVDERWANFVNENRNVLTPENVAAFYVVDEPVWNGVEFADFDRVLALIKTTFPQIPTLSIEAYPVLDKFLVTDQLDWLGFDRYDSVDPYNDAEWLSDLNTVSNSRTNAEQKIVIVASTQWLPYYNDAGIKPEDMASIASSYFDVANSQEDVVAVIGYLWPSGLDAPEQLGARHLPNNVQKTLIEIGKLITKK